MLKIKGLRIRVRVFLFLVFSGFAAAAQRPFGNEWIDFSQPYYKINIPRDGIYRLDQNALASAGVNISALNPQKLQLYFRGGQVPLYIAGESDGTFDAGDYIEFWGRRNDGAFDALLFNNPADITHTDFSTYTDTAAYFLTISENGPYARFANSVTSSGAGAIQHIVGSKAKYFRNLYQDGSPVIYDDMGRFIPEYTSGEGWMSSFINVQNSAVPRVKTDTFTLDDAWSGSSFTPTLEFKVVSQNFSKTANPDHRLQVDVQSSSASRHTIFDTTYEAYQVIRRTVPLALADLQGQTIVTIVPVNISGLSTIAVAYEKITYEKELNAASQLNIPFHYGPHAGGGNITFGFKVPGGFGTPGLLLYDLAGGSRSQGFYENGMVYFSLPAPGVASTYVVVKEGEHTAAAASLVTLRNIDLGQGYNFLMVTHPKLLGAAQQYADYKKTQKINDQENFKPLVVTVHELYDVFSYGVKHPIAIQNFCAYMYKKASSPPQYLFLFGKGIPINVARSNTRDKDSVIIRDKDLVPTIGLPASDIQYIAGIQSGFTGVDSLRPVMGVGRLPARTEADALAYLQKLKEYDNSPPSIWHKETIHVGGGQDLFVQNMAESILRRTGDIYRRPNVGGKIDSFLAKSTNVLNRDLRGVIQARIEKGAGLLTYYGHAAGTLLGVEIADFSTLSNKEKYPIMYLNGCNVGDPSIYEQVPIGENYLVAPDKGSIIWMSHSNTALSNTLENQMIRFYQNMGGDSLYGASVGKIWAKSLIDLKVPRSVSSMDRNGAFAWIIQGDPSVRFRFRELPDYAVYDPEIFISPADVVASADVFYLNIPISNLGKATDALPSVCVKQVLPNGQVWEHETQFFTHGIYYKDTFQLAIYPGSKPVQGLNRFIVEINCEESIEEMEMANNRAEYQFYIPGTGARALFPSNYAVVGTDTVTLYAQSRDLFDTAVESYFEMDTVHTFSSPFRKSSGLIKGSNIVPWKAQLLSEDSVVYYWRARLNLPADSGGDWDVRSFTYLKGRGPGWSQSQWPQLQGITGEGILVDTAGKKLGYQRGFGVVGARMVVYDIENLGIHRDGTVMTVCWYGSGTLALMEFDRLSLKPVISRTLQGTPKPSCNGREVYYLTFNMTDPAGRDEFIDYINSIDTGNYVAIMTRYPIQSFKDWEPDVIDAFRKIGAKKVQDIQRDSTIYAVLGIKGETVGRLLDENSEDYVYDPDPKPAAGDTVDIRGVMEGVTDPNGAIRSENIGPSSRWRSVHHHWKSLEDTSDDETYIQVVGINDSTGEEEVIINRLDADSADLSGVDASVYKFIYLRAVFSDTSDYTPAQFGDWTVLYDGVPEGTLAIDSEFRFEDDTVVQGEKVYIKIKYHNISAYPMKEVLVSTALMNEEGHVVGNAQNRRYPALQPGAHFYVEDTFIAGTELGGNHLLAVSVNPDFDQPEISLENNFVKIPFYVPGGRYNPLMDVTFDGRHLRNMDIVSSRPRIVVNAWGHNSEFPLYDTSFFELTLAGPDSTAPRRISFSSPDIVFEEGTPEENHARIRYTPSLEPGIYTFTAQVRDVKGHVSGVRPYSVTFRVMGEDKASRVYLYPNPVTGSSRFVFILTGEQVPDLMSVQIFNLRGQLVNEISLHSSNAHIGYNEVRWDGTSANGNILPDGLYIYRVVMKREGMEIPIYGLPEDFDLEKNYGKIQVLRR